MGPTTASSKSIFEYFFHKVDGVLWQCMKCLKTKAKSGGWTKLLSYLHSCVEKDYEQLFAELEKLKASKEGGRYFVQISNCKNLSLLWWRICLYHLLTAPNSQHYTVEAHICPTFRCHILELLSVVEKIIQAELPPKFIICIRWVDARNP